jgi:NAD(P)-dependent dehydrogenase (short-subunit alcohol dehydrogenase family)
LDILVNLAGRGSLKSATEVSLEEWDHIMNVFLRSTFLFCQAVGKHMIQRGSGSIINISSIASLVALGRGVAPYSAAKAGINALTRELAVEWARKGVRVNAIAPCRILTTPLQDQLDDPATDAEALMASWTDNIPIGRLGKPEEIVGPVIFLASSASSLVTGHILTVDGGYTIA